MGVLSLAFGLLMVAAATGSGAALVLVAVSACAVVVGTRFVGAATFAVACVALLLVFTDPAPMAAGLAGLSATAYLVLRHAAAEATGLPTIVGALGFSAAALLAAVVPLRLAWLPLAAPAVALIVYVIVAWPFMADRGGATAAPSPPTGLG